MLLAQSLHATFINHHGPARSRHEAEPALTAVEFLLGTNEQSSFGIFKNHLVRQHLHSAREECVATTLRHVADSFELATHSAGTHGGARLAGLTRERKHRRRNLRHKTQQTSIRILLRIVIEEAVFIRKNQEQVSIEEQRHIARKLVVIAHLDFSDSQRIVFVDNRNNLTGKHSLDGVLQVLVTSAVAEVFGRQKNLANRELHPAEHFAVGIHQVNLAHSSAGLLFSQDRRLFLVAQLAHARTHGTTCHNHDFLARFHQASHGISKLLNIARAYTALFGIHQNAGTNLYDNAVGFIQNVLS